MTVRTPDDIEKISQDDEENDGSNNVSCNPVDPGPNFDNVFQICQNPEAIGSLRGLMTHQVPQNRQSSQPNHTVRFQAVVSRTDYHL